MRHTAAAAALFAALTLLPITSAVATSLPVRTFALSVSPSGTGANGASADPVLSSSGRVLAFDTTADNLGGEDGNGPIRDVVAVDMATNERRIVSAPPGVDGGGDGPSSAPALAHDGQRVAFVSEASNLVAGDTNGLADVFVRDGRDALRRVSIAADGAQADGASSEPDIADDGRTVVFTSAATNLVPEDTNGQPDVFAVDVDSGAITRVSVASDEGEADGRSLAPSISANGAVVAFASTAPDLVPADANGTMDVFVRDLRRGSTGRVSVSSTGREQNASVAAPFVQLSDISANGRYVVFDSDADRLTPGDTNRHTDVFVRDRTRRLTRLVSASSVNVQGNNDSFAPRLSRNGRFVSFESFSTNLAVGDGPREDIFVRDLRQGTTTVVNVTADGSAREPEQVRQLLQRPALSNDGTFAAFSSTAPNLVPGDANAAQDVFVRLMDPPVGRIVSRPPVGQAGTVRVSADDPQARTFVCRVDAGRPYRCGPRITLRPGRGRRLEIRAGGAGMLFDPDPIVLRLPRR